MLKWLKVVSFTLILISSTYFLSLNLKKIFEAPNFLFSLKFDSYLSFLWLILGVYFVAGSFALVVTLSPGIYSKIASFILSSLSVFLVFEDPLFSMIAASLLFVVFLFGTWEIRNQIVSYFHFNPKVIFSSSLHPFTTLLTIILSVGFFFSYNSYIQKNGFSLPQELIDQVAALTVKNISNQISQEGGQRLKVDPDQLKKLGLKEQDLESALSNNTELASQVSGKLSLELRGNLQNLINPYLSFIPIVAAVLLFFTTHSLVGLGFFLIPMALSLVFFVLEKTKIISFEEQTQVVKRLVLEGPKAKIVSEENVSDSELKSQMKNP